MLSYFTWHRQTLPFVLHFLDLGQKMKNDLGRFHDAWIVFALQSNGVGAMRRSHVEFLKRVTFTNKPSITVTVNVFCAHVLFANFGQNKFLPQMIMYLLLKLIHQQSSATQWADRCIAKNIYFTIWSCVCLYASISCTCLFTKLGQSFSTQWADRSIGWQS